MTDRFDLLARWHGIPAGYTDAHGTRRRVPVATRAALLRALGVDPQAEAPDRPGPDRSLSVPEGVQCFVPDGLAEAPAWGVFCQLYELRSARNWGIGDFRDLADLARIAAARGADFLGVNPLHALFTADPARCSPFAPSNRAFLNPLYIAVDDVPGHGGTTDGALADVRAADRVDYPNVARLKLAALRQAWRDVPFADAAAREDHAAFGKARGDALRRHALFEALSARMVQDGHGAGWTAWPDEFRDPQTPAVQSFAAQQADEVEFHAWLQWLADRQLATAQAAARDAGMRIGLYLDLAVGEAPDGSAGWGGRLMLRDVKIGAPPDLYQSNGQDWGLAAPSPAAFEAQDFAPFRDMIRAQLNHAGALRIDHVMALWQLFLIPQGKAAAKGGYLRYPLAGLLAALAAESHAARAIVVGEDLGSVPRGFRGMMAEARILSYRLLYFEQNSKGFIAPERYPRSALACLSTHDLPTLSDWWQGRDIVLRERCGLVDSTVSALHAKHRDTERADLVRALVAADALAEGGADPAAASLPPTVLGAAHVFLARTPALLMAARLADLVGPEEPTNLPGTSDEYPNWQIRSPTPIEHIADHPVFREVSDRLAAERPRPGSTPATSDQ